MMPQPPPGMPAMENMTSGMSPQDAVRRQMLMQLLQRQGQGGQGNNTLVGAGSSAILGLLPLLMGRGGMNGGMKGPEALMIPPGPNGMLTGGV